jgi:hypothetical protein
LTSSLYSPSSASGGYGSEMEEHWKDVLWRAASKIMIEGGELRMIVIKRERDRIPEIYVYPDNKERCKKETIID